MSRPVLPTPVVGNEFVLPSPRLQAATPLPAPELLISLSSIPVESITHQELVPVSVAVEHRQLFDSLLELMHRYSLATFALLFLLVGSSGIQVAARYRAAAITNSVKPITLAKIKAPTIAGLNLSVPSAQLNDRIQAIINQPADIDLGGQMVSISPDVIKSWLKINTPSGKTNSYIQVKSDAMVTSLTDLVNQHLSTPLNQVMVTEDGTAQVIVTGKNGVSLTDPAAFKQMVQAAAKSVMDGSGLHFTAPTQTQAFATVGAEAFDKLIDANVSTKQAYFFEKGQLVRSYATSDGKPSTPTPLGEFHIFAKFASQDMKGVNGDGSTYFQPHVHWINYFLPGGYAVHGVYWHPLSWFGNINSSHGCVGLPDAEAEWVYNWAPVGTTVITHA